MSRFIGVHLTHDAAVAVIENGRLLFSVEMEKIANAPRYAAAKTIADIEGVLQTEGITISPHDIIAIDGWKRGTLPAPFGAVVAPYHEFDSEADELCFEKTIPSPFDSGASCVSYTHCAGHVYGAYLTAPFAGELSAYCVVWDGGVTPRLYWFDKDNGATFNCQVGKLGGAIYGIMGLYAGPFKNEEIRSGTLQPTPTKKLYAGYEVPGKLMSWIALGKRDDALTKGILAMYDELPQRALNYQPTGADEHAFMLRVVIAFPDAREEDLLLAVHSALERAIVRDTIKAVPKNSALCFVGGSALNIKWNTALRESGHFSEVWVPPFPNDSGSAIGAACVAAFFSSGLKRLDWSVYCGPELVRDELDCGWAKHNCSIKELAAIIVSHPTVVLYGRAEAGPRALGHRSIFANPADIESKNTLNKFKNREHWRPVAPIAKEERTAAIFSPGTPDPYMLFDHEVRPEWKERIPAVVHIDGTARLQTVSEKDGCPVVRELLTEFETLTGLPVLCNTSANFNGSGFFPDIASAQRWGQTKFIWANGILYERC